MTPKIIWQYWHDATPPPHVAGWMAGWDDHPGWDHRVLNQEAGRAEIARFPDLLAVWDDIPRLFPDDTPRKQSDVLRLGLLLAYGGVWLDSDMETTGASLDPLTVLGPTLCWEATGVAAIGMIASPPDTPYLGRVAAHFGQAHRRRFAASAKGDNPTGPLFWTALTRDDVTVLARDTCYPFGWKDWPEPPGPFPNSLMVHHWNSATNKGASP